ncbi:tRNA (adenosine(37)-N6)-threonylcarbamoyltransferase complex dimerization subunit type 1 TsaB [Estrella lausannensis]|uniref:Metalloprotease n=1 Tax=Estrella lausannensis TaxID=483423 RepID=A0A0H5E5P2_9BACT|nr:tRNA (adenosine(37)-N6)-threonylcarbamoyltransferase complex dimerization subunit type 1 TsaB [Estrella lausannensis]CRX38555.1 Metalloprotease [Estrella lausannensis]
MKALLIETATEDGICALFSESEILFHSGMPRGFQHSRFLLSEMEKGLLAAEVSVKELAFIAIGIGPGSYTGVRVGAMVAKTLSFAGNVPLVAVSSLEGVRPKTLKNGSFIAAFDAKIAGAYVLFGEVKGGEIHYVGTPQVLTLEKLAEVISEETLIVSPHAHLLQKKWQEKGLHSNAHFEEAFVLAEGLIQSALLKFKQGQVTEADDLKLLYLRESV